MSTEIKFYRDTHLLESIETDKNVHDAFLLMKMARTYENTTRRPGRLWCEVLYRDQVLETYEYSRDLGLICID
jgi:hypothetical protein